MKNRQLLPQWLKEIVDRGFKPPRLYDDYSDYLFAAINSCENEIITFPKKFIFSLEGLPGSGKTTTLNSFENDSNIIRVNQILPFESIEPQPVEFYLKSDEEKTKQSLESENKICLLDRYYVSTMAFYWASDKIKKTHDYNEVLNWYYKGIRRGTLIKPFGVFHIETPIELSYLRKDRNPDSNNDNPWLNPTFLKHFEDYYHYFYTSIEPQTKVYRLDGRKTQLEILNEIKSILKKHE